MQLIVCLYFVTSMIRFSVRDVSGLGGKAQRAGAEGPGRRHGGPGRPWSAGALSGARARARAGRGVAPARGLGFAKTLFKMSSKKPFQKAINFF